MVHVVTGYRGGAFGFFSSHASNTFTIAAIASMLFKNRSFSITIFVWAIVVSYTRIYLGLHYPGDILTGWIWGAVFGFGFYKLMIFIQEKYFKAVHPDIRITSISRNDALIAIIFVIIYAATILVTINRLTKYQFFAS
jgi:undecaprenyl-diphosphatase